MKKEILILLLLIVFYNVFGEQPSINPDSLITNKHYNFRIPMYEKSNNYLNDFRVNQTIQQTIRWANIGAGIGVSAALIFAPDDDYGLAPLAFGLLGTTLGVIGGPIYGFVHGHKLEKYKKDNPFFHTRRYRLGNEFSSVIPFTKVASFNPKYYLNLQTFPSKKFSPSEYRLGIIRKEWNNENRDHDMEGYTHWHFAEEIKLDFNILFNSNKRIINLFYGAGIGYSWGENRDTYHPDDNNNSYIYENTKLEGLFIHPIAGVSINFADFFFGRLEINYEFSSFFYKAREYNDYPYSGNAHLSFSLGTYLF